MQHPYNLCVMHTASRCPSCQQIMNSYKSWRCHAGTPQSRAPGLPAGQAASIQAGSNTCPGAMQALAQLQ